MDSVLPSDDDGEVVAAGGPVDKFRVTFAIYHRDLDPDAVSTRVGVQPTSSHRRGESRRPGSPPLPGGGWFIKSEAFPPSQPSDAITELFARLPSDNAFWEALRADYKVQLRVGVHTDGWNRGFALSPSAIRCIETAGIEVDFDLYFYGGAYEA